MDYNIHMWYCAFANEPNSKCRKPFINLSLKEDH